jgi:hypothetical protein
MKYKLLLGFVAIAATFAMSATPAMASSGTFRDGPYTATTSDSGTCGPNWAQDVFVRRFVVTLPGSGGTYNVTENFQRGHFSTYAGQSPASCDTNPGGTVPEGITGNFHGTFGITISGGTFDANGSCETTDYAGGPANGGWTQCDTAGWVHGFFGNGASYTVGTYSFTYNAPGQGIFYHTWVNANTGNSGDIGNQA